MRKRSPAELKPPGAARPHPIDPGEQLRAYRAQMRREYLQAFPAIGRSTASRLRALYGQDDALDYYATPKKRG